MIDTVKQSYAVWVASSTSARAISAEGYLVAHRFDEAKTTARRGLTDARCAGGYWAAVPGGLCRRLLGGRHPRLADYVTGMKLTRGRPPPEGRGC
jgi:hypothetical protein